MNNINKTLNIEYIYIVNGIVRLLNFFRVQTNKLKYEEKSREF